MTYRKVYKVIVFFGFMKTKHEVVYGGLGCGKSTYAFSIINPEETCKLGVGSSLRDVLIFKFGSKGRHEAETTSFGIEPRTTSLRSIVCDISQIENPIFLLDEWTTFFSYSVLWPSKKIITRANDILDAVEENPNIERGVYIALDYIPYMPFNLYKKKALWNKILFERATDITRVDYGKPRKVFP